jgi:predicted nuclease of predicted toxin-antitoxin system
MMKLLVDMNLAPAWAPFLQANGFEAIHWSSVGAPDALDEEIFRHAQSGLFVLLTQDLDFSAMLGLTGASGPSVVQIRAVDVAPDVIGARVLLALRRHERELHDGAIVSIDPFRARVRVLPLAS